LVLQLAAALGLWLTRTHWRRLWPTYLVFALVTAFHALTIVSARFHLPLEPIEWIWAGLACAIVAQWVRRATSGCGALWLGVWRVARPESHELSPVQ
jgi:hypothetical protein